VLRGDLPLQHRRHVLRVLPGAAQAHVAVEARLHPAARQRVRQAERRHAEVQPVRHLRQASGTALGEQ